MTSSITRHGESLANAQQVFAGQSYDAPLTELGVTQAYELAESLKTAAIDRIVSSPTSRALDTAQIIAKILRVDTLVEDGDLAEYDMGVLSGMPISSIASSDEFFAASGAEDPDTFRDRVVRGILRHHRDDEHTLFVSHNGVMRALLTVTQDLPARSFRDLPKRHNARVEPIDIESLRQYAKQINNM